MAGIKISALPAVPNALLTDYFPVVQAGVTSRESVQQLVTLISGQFLPLAGGTMTGNIDMDNNFITNVPDPINPQDAVNKRYVDLVALTSTSVRAATTANLNATQSGSGVGATLTDASGTFAQLTLDSVTINVGQDVLVKDQTLSQHDGIYQLTTQGDGVSIPWVLTRSTRYDTPSEINSTGLIVVRDGSTQADTGWYNTDTMVAVDTTPFNFVEFGNQGTVTNVAPDDSTLIFSPNPITTSGTIRVNTSSFIRNVVTQTFTGNGTYTPTVGMIYCVVEIVGGGGGGGGVAASGGQTGASGGGGGGGYCRKSYTSTEIGANAAVVIGSAGAAAASGNNTGGTGGNSTFTPSGLGSTLTASGGAGGGGANGAATFSTSAAGGVGGTGTNGDLNIPGGSGGVGIIVDGASSQGMSGLGGNSFLSGVRGGVRITSGALTGLNYGGGGTGRIVSNANAAGIAGAPGFAIITEYTS